MKLNLPNQDKKEKALKVISKLKPETLEAIAKKITIGGRLIIGVDKLITDGLKKI